MYWMNLKGQNEGAHPLSPKQILGLVTYPKLDIQMLRIQKKSKGWKKSSRQTKANKGMQCNNELVCVPSAHTYSTGLSARLPLSTQIYSVYLFALTQSG